MTNSLAEPIPRPPGALRSAPYWVLAFVALWPLPGIAEGVLVLGALFAAVVMVVRRCRAQPRLLGTPAWALTAILFLAYWLPQAFSAVDAIDPGAAWGKALGGLRYLPFMWLAAMAVATPQARRTTFDGLAVIVAVWTADAVVQAISGTSPLYWGLDQLKWAVSGHGLCAPAEAAAADRLSGVLGPCNLKFGQVLASLSPFLLLWAAARAGLRGWLLASVLVGAVLVLAGSRASWLTYALILVVSGHRLLGGRRLMLVMVGVAVLALGLGISVPQVRERIQRTTMAFNGDAAGVDQALSGRAQIWQAAACMIREHPINGVGARGFRDAWPLCASDQQAVWGDRPALHAHQIVLEILAETGLVGLLLWLAGAAQAWRAWRFAPVAARAQARPAMLALVATVFPLNTHLAFHSTFWGGLTLLLAALYAGSLLGRNDDAAQA